MRLVAAPDVPVDPDALPADRFLDREISWLQFNERVLQLAADESVPLLERARYLAIFASNLDEFFMVRVAGLKRRIATGLAVRSASGLEPREVLEQISAFAHELTATHARVFDDQVRPALIGEGITIVRWDELSPDEQEGLHGMFRDQIFPVLTPLAVDPAHPFPYISGLSLNLAVLLVNPKTQVEHFARVKVPLLLPRFVQVQVPNSQLAQLYNARFVPLEDIIAAHLEQLFPGMQISEHFTFRVTRNEDLEVEEDDAENLLTALEKELTRRRFGPPVRLEIAEDMDDHVLDLLERELGVHADEVYRLPAPLDLRGLELLADLERSELKYPAFVPKTHPDLAAVESSHASDILASIRAKDILLQHPYDSFSTSVQAFIEQAAADPKVLAIKQTLYRTSGDSPVVDALVDAAEAGKQVLAVVEIKARFDEQANISWARKLEHAGVHVVYGIVGLKTHAKLALVVRQEADGLRRYCHIGTGNYNPKTARMYEDVGLLTCNPQVGEDLTRLFNQLSGWAPRSKFRRLLVAPRSVRTGLIAHIETEIANAEAGLGGYVGFKLNSIVDDHIIDALYRASRAGVDVDLWVRGICALRPGVKGLSENIRVHSVLGRFLEHSRVFIFGGGGGIGGNGAGSVGGSGSGDGGDDGANAGGSGVKEGAVKDTGVNGGGRAAPIVLIGSADMMHRNLDRRVEALVRLSDPAHVAYMQSLMTMGMSDDVSSWHLDGDGQWTRHSHDAKGNELIDLQSALIESNARRRRKARRR